jgi:hypothetical protein
MCAFEGVGFCSCGRQIVIGSFFFFFFLKFRMGVGKTGLSGLTPSPLVPEQLGVGRSGGNPKSFKTLA